MTDFIKGIDISTIQGAVNFAAVAATGVQFIICRCGVGNDGIDGNYAKNIAAAKAAGLKTACYHFIYPLPADPTKPLRDPVAQAQYHFKASLGEIACCDLEWPEPKDWAKWGVTAEFINKWALAYLSEYERLSGRKMVVYTYNDFAKNVKLDLKFAEYPLWIASYTNPPTVPPPWADWVLCQTGIGKLPNGVPVDTDVAKDLSLWDVPAATSAPPPASEVTPSVVVSPPVAPPPVPVTPVNSKSIWQVLSDLFAGLFKK